MFKYDCKKKSLQKTEKNKTKFIDVMPTVVGLNSTPPNNLSNKAVKILDRGKNVGRYTTRGK